MDAWANGCRGGDTVSPKNPPLTHTPGHIFVESVKIPSTETSRLPVQLELDLSRYLSCFFQGGEEHLIVTVTFKQKPESQNKTELIRVPGPYPDPVQLVTFGGGASFGYFFKVLRCF